MDVLSRSPAMISSMKLVHRVQLERLTCVQSLVASPLLPDETGTHRTSSREPPDDTLHSKAQM